jgi:nanoRNase/pAp phosphatase (c-di-AMP/oligoRNAs hydrolase)
MKNQQKPEDLRALFRELLSKYHGKKIVILSHSKMDVDGLASAFAISNLLPGSVICYCEKPNYGAEILAERIGIKTGNIDSLNKKEFDGMIVVDSSTSTLVPAAKRWNVIAIIDHHQPEGRDLKAPYMFIEPCAVSTAEIIESIVPPEFWESKQAIQVAYALAAAIIADGARFKSARQQSFAALSRLMNICQAEYSELLSIAEPETKEENKIAILKAFQRVQYVYCCGYIVATSEVGSSESEAASLIVEAADVAFVASWKDKEKETRISARARHHVMVPLNKVMKEISKELGGNGGGHEKAAGAYVKVHTEEALKKCVEVFQKQNAMGTICGSV